MAKKQITSKNDSGSPTARRRTSAHTPAQYKKRETAGRVPPGVPNGLHGDQGGREGWYRSAHALRLAQGRPELCGAVRGPRASGHGNARAGGDPARVEGDAETCVLSREDRSSGTTPFRTIRLSASSSTTCTSHWRGSSCQRSRSASQQTLFSRPLGCSPSETT